MCAVLHADLKPRNLLVNSNCDLKICDYGPAQREKRVCVAPVCFRLARLAMTNGDFRPLTESGPLDSLSVQCALLCFLILIL